MEILGLHHFNITAPSGLLEKVRDFYVDVLGLNVGERPGFTREGYWLYAGREPIVHLTASDETDARSDGEPRARNFFDHVAFSCEGLSGMIERLKHLNIPYEVIEIASLGQLQLFLQDPAGVGIELNFTSESLA